MSIASEGRVIAGTDSTPPTEADEALDISTSHLGAIASVPGWRAIGAALNPGLRRR